MQRKKWSELLGTVSESGQAIVLIGLAAMALIAIMGLAIDGGRLLLLDRDSQNASDAAAFAAARALCEGRSDYVEAGLAAAARNGFTDGENGSTVTINSPPTNASIDIPEECRGCYVEAQVGREIPASFIGIAYDGPLQATGHAVGSCNPNQFTTFEEEDTDLRGLFGLAPNCDVTINGSDFNVIGGAHSNGTMTLDPKSGTGTAYGEFSYYKSLSYNASEVKLCPGDDDCPDDWNLSSGGGATFTAAGQCDPSCFGGLDTSSGTKYGGANPYKVDNPLPDPLAYNIADFAPGGTYANQAQADGGRYYEYTGMCNKTDVRDWVFSHINDSVLDTGLYYFGDCEVNMQNFTGIKGTVTWVVDDNWIWIANDSGWFSGGKNNHGNSLTAYIDDLLFFSNTGDNQCLGFAVTLTSSNNTYNGNVYAPHGKIYYSAPNTDVNGCLVAWRPEIIGPTSSVNCLNGGELIGSPGIWLSQ